MEAIEPRIEGVTFTTLRRIPDERRTIFHMLDPFDDRIPYQWDVRHR